MLRPRETQVNPNSPGKTNKFHTAPAAARAWRTCQFAVESTFDSNVTTSHFFPTVTQTSVPAALRA